MLNYISLAHIHKDENFYGSKDYYQEVLEGILNRYENRPDGLAPKKVEDIQNKLKLLDKKILLMSRRN